MFSVKRGSYQQYDHEALDNAFAVVKDGTSVNGAAKRFGVPLATLRDRVDGRVHLDTFHAGAAPMFNQEQ